MGIHLCLAHLCRESVGGGGEADRELGWVSGGAGGGCGDRAGAGSGEAARMVDCVIDGWGSAWIEIFPEVLFPAAAADGFGCVAGVGDGSRLVLAAPHRVVGCAGGAIWAAVFESG